MNCNKCNALMVEIPKTENDNDTMMICPDCQYTLIDVQTMLGEFFEEL